VGKFTHPSGAPDNHLLTVYSPGPVNHQYTFLPQLNGGIYLLKNGKPIEEPSQLLLIKSDPNYNACWPRAVVSYLRTYLIEQPPAIPQQHRDGEGSPFAFIGTSSFYKRESYPNGAVTPIGAVTAKYFGGNDPWKGLDAFTSHGNGMPLNWHNQGADAGLYTNEDIHAVRILVMEPTTDRKGAVSGRHFYNHAQERMRILGEIPIRKFESVADASGSKRQPKDQDGNLDTSFMARIPADTAFTFQTLDKRGMVLNMAQTWHQLRPGEIRTNCGGCHAHSQAPTEFSFTVAGGAHEPWDLVNSTPLLIDKSRDESKKQWDTKDETGLRTIKSGPLNVEYFRDIQPILKRSCVECHSDKVYGKKEEVPGHPMGNLNLDADDEMISHEQLGKFPGTYLRLALDEKARFGYKPVGYDSWGYPNASRYIRMFQSRRSLLVWKIFGERLDGFSNDDFPSEAKPGDREHLVQKGQPVDLQKNRSKWDLDFVGSQMPPPEAVKTGKVKPLSDEDRRTIVRWIDLGCPIDLDFDPTKPQVAGYGWMMDDNRPILNITDPIPGRNEKLSRILVGMYDYGSGLDMDSFRVTADFAIDGIKPGENLALKFQPKSQGVWEYKFPTITDLKRGKITVSIADKAGNINRMERTISTGELRP
jgi:Hydrazine synthase alpha subunit middle domain